MQIIIQVDKTDPFVSKLGLSEDRFFSWTEEMTRKINQLVPISGTGSPEASIIGFLGQLYIDTSASVGTGLYHKEAGDGLNTGWVARS